MPWGIIFSSTFWSSVIALLGPIISKFLQWFLTGALKSFLIYAGFLTISGGLIYFLIDYANQIFIDAVQSMSGMKSVIYGPFAAMLPPSLVTCVSIVGGVYITGVGYNIAKEIAKLKLRMAERAAGFMKA